MSNVKVCLRFAIRVFAVLLCVTAWSEPASRYEFFEPVQPPRAVQVVAHRGLKAAAPENTLPAFQAAVDAGFEWVELDVRLTSDGKHVVLHDSTVDRTTNGTGSIKEMTLAELRELDAGTWFAPRFTGAKVPTFSETLEFCKGKVNLNVDCKDVDPELLVNEIRSAAMERQVVVFGDPALLQRIKQLSGGTIPLQPGINSRLDVQYWVDLLQPAAVEVYAENITPELVKGFHEAGVIVQPQTLGDRDRPEVWRRCIEMGVDWIQTDYAENVLAEYARILAGDRWPVRISAHRGANTFAPENTLPAYRKAIDLGADLIEVDVRTTRDGEIVSVHDSTLDRTTDATGPVEDKTLDELKRLSAGAWFGAPYRSERIPTLDEICTLVNEHPGPRGTVALYVDMKDVEPGALAAILNRYDLANSAVYYGSPGELLDLRKHAPNSRLMPGLGASGDLAALASRVQPYALDTRWRILSAELIENAHAMGIRIYSDSMGQNETVEAYTQAMKWDIDLIQTDHIPRVNRAVELMVGER